MINFLYNIWCVFWLVGIYLVLFPFIFVCIQIESLNKYGTKLTNLWADLFFFVSGLWVKTEYRFKPVSTQNYVFVANHFSYLDIAVGMKVVRNYFSYMGKASVKNVPLLGYMFTKLHIQVDRSDKNSRIKSYKRSLNALKNRSLFIMPEGGIVSENIPEMKQPFKDGAFALAKETNTPIVPISLLNLYEIMPNKKIFWGFPRVVVHLPILVENKTVEELKLEVYNTIQTEINRYGNRIRNH